MRLRLQAIGLGLAAALFFSSTFFINRWISLGGEHWFWTASLRFVHMALLLSAGLYTYYGHEKLKRILSIFTQHWQFWVTASTVGYGLFYFPLCFSSVYVDGWITSSTWQLTVVASPIVVSYLFRKSLTWKPLAFASIICLGVFFVNFEHTETQSLANVLLGALPVVGAAFAYPIGNQMVKESTKGGFSSWVPAIKDDLVNNSFVQVFLMTLGSLPFWVLFAGGLETAISLPAPTLGQVFKTFLVALCSGVIATSLLYHARHNVVESSYGIVMVDATQAGEVVFTLLAELLWLQAVMPDTKGWIGLFLIIAGMTAYSYFTKKEKEGATGG